MLKNAVLGFVLTIFASSSANATPFSVGTSKITSVESTYAPGQLRFKTNMAAGNCAAGSVLFYNAVGSTAEEKIANINAVLAVLLTAKATASNFQYGGDDSNCSVTFTIITN